MNWDKQDNELNNVGGVIYSASRQKPYWVIDDNDESGDEVYLEFDEKGVLHIAKKEDVT